MPTQPWLIVLAAGAGRRLSSVTGGVPKQYWHAKGTLSLVEETASRVEPIASFERTFTVVDARHGGYVESLERPQFLGHILFQPEDRGTAVGVLLPLVKILASARDPLVVITPSDHAIADSGRFRKGLHRALAHVRAGASDIVLFGADPTTPCADYGWITPANGCVTERGTFEPVAAFVEKPSANDARRLFSTGAVWNTMVVVARARALLDRFLRYLPFHADVLLHAEAGSPANRETFLRDWYPSLPMADFCRDLLTASATDLWLYTWPHDVGWSDLGTPDRLEAWLALNSARAEWSPGIGHQGRM